MKKGIAIFAKRIYICGESTDSHTKGEKNPLRFIYPNIVSEMDKRGLDYHDLADILGISKYAAYRRLRGFAGWKLHETIRLCQYFDISDAAWLFYSGDTISQNF